MFSPATIAADSAREVGYLLDYVAASGCTFYRNGKAYAPERAADHLRMKYKRVKKRLATEVFIDKVASQSSITGRDYQVACEAGRIVDAGPWLHAALARQRAQAQKTTQH